MKYYSIFTGILLLGVLLLPIGKAKTAITPQDAPPFKESLGKAFAEDHNYSPYAGRDYPTRVFWGDTHLHTSYSFDAGSFGNRLGPEDSYTSLDGL